MSQSMFMFSPVLLWMKNILPESAVLGKNGLDPKLEGQSK